MDERVSPNFEANKADSFRLLRPHVRRSAAYVCHAPFLRYGLEAAKET